MCLDNLVELEKSLISQRGRATDIGRSPSVWSTAGQWMLVVCRIRDVLLGEGFGGSFIWWVQVNVSLKDVLNIGLRASACF